MSITGQVISQRTQLGILVYFYPPFLTELGIRIFLLDTLLYEWEQNLLIIGYLPHRLNSNGFFQNFNWVNTPKSSLSKVLCGSNIRNQFTGSRCGKGTCWYFFCF